MDKGELYDFFMRPLEVALLRRWRRRLWAPVRGPRVLELGSGTGANLPYHPEGVSVVALDRDPDYLRRARSRAAAGEVPPRTIRGCAENIPFRDGAFDEVVFSFLLCSVDDPSAALDEVYRVLHPGGRVHLLEHCRPRGPMGTIFSALAPTVRRRFGDRIDGEPWRDLARAGFVVETVVGSGGGTLRLIVARKPDPVAGDGKWRNDAGRGEAGDGVRGLSPDDFEEGCED